VGQWTVNDGPFWTLVPPAYTAQQAAALLFGGVPSDYAISTTGTDPSQIDHQAYASVWGGANGLGCGVGYGCTIVPENYDLSQDGSGNYVTPGDVSTYVNDWCFDCSAINYAFAQSKRRANVKVQIQSPNRDLCPQDQLWCAKESRCAPWESSSLQFVQRCK